MPDAVVLMIDGERKLLRTGQAHGGVTVIAVEATEVLLELEGRRTRLGLSQRVATQYVKPEQRSVSIVRNALDQYQTTALIDGRPVLVLVDTGATSVAMSEDAADRLGIDYFSGEKGRSQTASGVVNTRIVTLRSVSVGGIEVENVRAAVLEGSYPRSVLLGMSYLNHVEMTEANGILTLSGGL